MRQTSSLGFLTVLFAGGTIVSCASDSWLDESNPSGNHLFDSRQAREIRSFWYVSASHIDAAAKLLKTRAIVSISPTDYTPTNRCGASPNPDSATVELLL